MWFISSLKDSLTLFELLIQVRAFNVRYDIMNDVIIKPLSNYLTEQTTA